MNIDLSVVLIFVIVILQLICFNIYLYAQKTDTAYLRVDGDSSSGWKGTHLFIKNHSYHLSLGDINKDGLITYDSGDLINLRDDSGYQTIGVILNHDPTIFKIYESYWDFRILDDSGKKVEYKQVDCNQPIKGSFINSLPVLKIHDFFTDKYVSLDSINMLNKSESSLLIHFMSMNCPPCLTEMPLLLELKKRHIKTIIFIYYYNGLPDKMDVKKMLKKYNIKENVYLDDNGAIGRNVLNIGGFPYSILFPKHKNAVYFRWGGSYEEVLDYLHDHEELVK